MKKLFASSAVLIGLATILVWAQQGNQVIPQGGGGQSVAPNLVTFYGSPNCGTQTNCLPLSSVASDNNANFTALFNAANLYAPLGPLANPAFSNSGSDGLTSNTITTNLPAGSTAYVIFDDSLGKALTITTSSCASNCGFSLVGSSVGTVPIMQIYSGTITTAATTITLTWSGTEIHAQAVVDLPGVKGTVSSSGSTGSSTAPSVSQTTTNTNSFALQSCGWYNGSAADSLTLGSGTNFINSAQADTGHVGLSVWGNFVPVAASSTSSGTLGSSASWSCVSAEVQGSSTLTPTVHLAQGYYKYSGGISLQSPMMLQCDPGTWLDYTGSAHAVDIGLQGLTSNNPVGGIKPRYVIEGCTFTDGASMTEGIYFQPYNELINLRHNTFNNFGNSSAHMFTGSCENWDVEVGPANGFYVYDGVKRNVGIMNQNHCTSNSFLRFHDNGMFCWPGPATDTGCSVSQAGIGVIVDGLTNRIYHNNMAFFLPLVELLCSNPASGTTCQNNQIDQNQMETAFSGVSGTPMIQFSNQQGTLITQNTMLMHGTGASPIGPVGGADVLTGARINFNTISQIALATPVVALNNVTGQGANYSYSNECSTALTSYLPCALMHTTGSNITQWNADNWPVLTFAASTTATYNFSTTYASAPHCTIPPNITGTATTLTITTLSTTQLVITASASNSATVFANCSAGDGQ